MRRPCPPNDSSKNRIDHNSLRWKKISCHAGRLYISQRLVGYSLSLWERVRVREARKGRNSSFFCN